MKIELDKYRNILASKGYSSVFNSGNRTLTILANDEVKSTHKCDYNCGTWYITIEDVK